MNNMNSDVTRYFMDEFEKLSGCCHAPLRLAEQSDKTSLDYMCTECGDYVFSFIFRLKKNRMPYGDIGEKY